MFVNCYTAYREGVFVKHMLRIGLAAATLLVAPVTVVGVSQVWPVATETPGRPSDLITPVSTSRPPSSLITPVATSGSAPVPLFVVELLATHDAQIATQEARIDALETEVAGE